MLRVVALVPGAWTATLARRRSVGGAGGDAGGAELGGAGAGQSAVALLGATATPLQAAAEQ